MAGGAAINVQIKSGTNELHGSAFEYYTGNALKAKPFFNPRGQRKPKTVFNQFGGSVGGPIIKDKLFYFASYEGSYNHQFTSGFGSVPTLAIRAGDMSASPRAVYDPAFEPIALKLVGLTPAPMKCLEAVSQPFATRRSMRPAFQTRREAHERISTGTDR